MSSNGTFRTVTSAREESIHESLMRQAWQVEILTERIAELEIAVEDREWEKVLGDGNKEFSRDGLQRIISMSRLMSIKNSLIKRAVEVQRLYVWALGVSIRAQEQEVDRVIQSFLKDPKNASVIGSHEARGRLEHDLQVEGNLFFAFFTDPSTGRVRVRLLPVDEIQDVYLNPEDKDDPWYYRRCYQVGNKRQDVYYPCYLYWPDAQPNSIASENGIGSITVDWDVRVYHVKVGGTSTMRFGVPEVYAAIDWATAYRRFLEDWATIMRAYARLAWQMSGLKGQAGVTDAKSRLNTTINPDTDLVERNPSSAAGATFLSTKGVEMKAIKTAGATTSADEGRPIKLMVAAAVGWPDTFFGDADVGNFATAQTLDRPTELKIVDRQELWTNILTNIFNFVTWASARAVNGKLRSEGYSAALDLDTLDNVYQLRVVPPSRVKADDSYVYPKVSVEFPPITEPNATERIRAVVGAATMLGKPIAPIINDMRMLARLVIQGLGIKDVDAWVDELYPPGKKYPVPDDLIAKPGQKPALGAAPFGGGQ